jgi:hypothetical protein
MKAYFIGGSADLTCRNMPDDAGRFVRQVKSSPIPIAEFRHNPPPPIWHVIYEDYQRYDLPEKNGRLIAVYVFAGDTTDK